MAYPGGGVLLLLVPSSLVRSYALQYLLLSRSATWLLPIAWWVRPGSVLAALAGFGAAELFRSAVPPTEADMLGALFGLAGLGLLFAPPVLAVCADFLAFPSLATAGCAVLVSQRSKQSKRQWASLFGLGLFGLGLARLVPFVRSVPLILGLGWSSHLNLVVYWLVVSVGGLLCGVRCVIAKPATTDQRARVRYVLGRKYFHLLVAAIAGPVCFCPSPFALCGLFAACVLYVLVETLRHLAIEASELLSFADDRDHHGLILTPGCLLLGAFVPVLIESCLDGDPFAASIGVIATCFADAGAALFGSLDTHLLTPPHPAKTPQGSLAYFVTFLAVGGLCQAALSEPLPLHPHRLIALVASGLASMVLEGYSTFIDNLHVSLGAYVVYKFIANSS